MNKKILMVLMLSALGLCIYTSSMAQQPTKEPSEKIQKGIDLLYTGKRAEAREIFKSALASDTDAADACFYLGLSYYDENQLITAKEYFLKAKPLYKAKNDEAGAKRAQDFINILTCESAKF